MGVRYVLLGLTFNKEKYLAYIESKEWLAIMITDLDKSGTYGIETGVNQESG